MRTNSILLAMLSLCVLASSCSAIPPLEPISRKDAQPSSAEQGIVTMPLKEAIAKYGRPDYAIDPDADIDMNTLVHIDTSLPWDKAFKNALAEVGLEVANPTAVKARKAAMEAKRKALVDSASGTATSTIATSALPAPAPGAGAGASATSATAVTAEGKDVGKTDAKNVAPVAQIPPPPVEKCTLTAGAMIHEELSKCGSKTGWKVIWNLQRDWTVPSSTTFEGDFPDAAGKVIETLVANGAVVRAKFYEGNKTMVVNSAGATVQ